jgi:NADPH:quinone reductase-like Zn-dependent oxidoreductase
VRAATIVDGRIEVADRPVPEPGDGEVLVRVAGAGLNRADLVQLAGAYPAPPGVPADIPGLEFAGTVEARGTGSVGVDVGARVFGITGGGAQAEYVVVPAPHCAPVPGGMDLLAMGGVPEAFVTAHDAMVTQAALQPDEWLLVHAVGSGVGTAALQLGKALGAHVIGTARTESKLDRCRELGLDVGIVPPRADGALDVDALALQIVEATGGGTHVALDLVGGDYVQADIAAAARRGRIVLVSAMAGSSTQLSVLSVMAKRLAIFGTMLRSRDRDEKGAAVGAFARDVVPLLARRAVEPVVDRVVPLADAPHAYELLASDATFGKVVLDCT